MCALIRLAAARLSNTSSRLGLRQSSARDCAARMIDHGLLARLQTAEACASSQPLPLPRPDCTCGSAALRRWVRRTVVIAQSARSMRTDETQSCQCCRQWCWDSQLRYSECALLMVRWVSPAHHTMLGWAGSSAACCRCSPRCRRQCRGPKNNSLMHPPSRPSRGNLIRRVDGASHQLESRLSESLAGQLSC